MREYSVKIEAQGNTYLTSVDANDSQDVIDALFSGSVMIIPQGDDAVFIHRSQAVVTVLGMRL